jgi:hypothetical protein
VLLRIVRRDGGTAERDEDRHKSEHVASNPGMGIRRLDRRTVHLLLPSFTLRWASASLMRESIQPAQDGIGEDRSLAPYFSGGR